MRLIILVLQARVQFSETYMYAEKMLPNKWQQGERTSLLSFNLNGYTLAFP